MGCILSSNSLDFINRREYGIRDFNLDSLGFTVTQAHHKEKSSCYVCLKCSYISIISDLIENNSPYNALISLPSHSTTCLKFSMFSFLFEMSTIERAGHLVKSSGISLNTGIAIIRWWNFFMSSSGM